MPTHLPHDDYLAVDGPGSRYRIVIRGEISERFAPLFDGMALRREHGTTIIAGTVRDQAHLHRLIEQVQELGIELVSVYPLNETEGL